MVIHNPSGSGRPTSSQHPPSGNEPFPLGPSGNSTAGSDAATLVTVPLPPPDAPTPSATDQILTLIRRFDRLLGLVVIVLAFLLASFAVRNSDFWMHAATGRALVHEKRLTIPDPFSYTSTSAWINHSWLYDVILYEAYTNFGGTFLVVLKALLITVLAALLLNIRRPRQSLWIPAVCTGVALLAMSPRLFLQTTILSYVFLGLTLFLLTKSELANTEHQETSRSSSARSTTRRLWLLPFLCAVWVNVDSWFFLGPVTVALYLVGEGLQSVVSRRNSGQVPFIDGKNRTLALVLVVSVLACLVNPHGIYAWRLPSEMAAQELVKPLQSDPFFRVMFYSPWQEEYFQPGLGMNVPGLSFFPLALLGVVSFILNRSAWRWWRACIWSAFFLLASYYARTIPFFAVVAAPITALNLQEWSAKVYGAVPRTNRGWRLWSLGGRSLTLVTGVFLLLMLTFSPSSLFGNAGNSRRIAWNIYIDPGLLKIAEQLRQWRADHLLIDDDHGFHTWPEIANYCAWFGADHPEKDFMDFRFQLFSPEVVKDYVEVRKALNTWRRPSDVAANKDRPGSTSSTDKGWQSILRKYGIKYVVFYDSDPYRLQSTLKELRKQPVQWTLAALCGRAVVLCWHNPEKKGDPETLAALRFDPDALVFGTGEVEKAATLEPRRPNPASWWTDIFPEQTSRHPATDEAMLDALYFEEIAYPWCFQNITQPLWRSRYLTAAVGSGFLDSDSLVGRLAAPLMQLALVSIAASAATNANEAEDLLAPTLLAVRRAREGVAANPQDAMAYVVLARAYLTLYNQTRERTWAMQMPELATLRHAQMMAALHQALELQPDLEPAHSLSAILHSEILWPWHDGQRMHLRMYFKDLAAIAHNEQLKAARAAGPASREDGKNYEKRIRDMENRQNRLDQGVKSLETEYQVRAAGKSVLQKARIALEFGLGKRALDLLMASQFKEIGMEGAVLEFELLLAQGRLKEFQIMTAELQELKNRRYARYRFLYAAALGDYREADRSLEETLTATEKDISVSAMLQQLGFLQVRHTEPSQTLGPREGIAALVGYAVLTSTPLSPIAVPQLAWQRWQQINAFVGINRVLFPVLQEQASLHKLRGLLALESGDTPAAARHFQQALAMAPKNSPLFFAFPGQSMAATYLAKIQEQMNKNRPQGGLK